jgi:hypothetical protein
MSPTTSGGSEARWAADRPALPACHLAFPVLHSVFTGSQRAIPDGTVFWTDDAASIKESTE